MRIGFRRNERGASLVEFALMFPVFVVLYLGMSYLTTISLLNRKLQSASYTLMNMMPYPRTFCDYRSYVTASGREAFFKGVVKELISPMNGEIDRMTIEYIEDVASTDMIKVRSRITFNYVVGSGENLIYKPFDNLRKLVRGSLTVEAQSPFVAMTNDSASCS